VVAESLELLESVNARAYNTLADAVVAVVLVVGAQAVRPILPPRKLCRSNVRWRVCRRYVLCIARYGTQRNRAVPPHNVLLCGHAYERTCSRLILCAAFLHVHT
jgi:hypothetical protein